MFRSGRFHVKRSTLQKSEGGPPYALVFFGRWIFKDRVRWIEFAAKKNRSTAGQRFRKVDTTIGG
jgi:hypothetical protein